MHVPFHEHDACGVGFVANLDGTPTHKIVEQGIQVLENLVHRGACGCDPETGDGAGILLQKPHRFFQEQAEALGFSLPAEDEYSAGMIFLPKEEEGAATCKRVVEECIAAEGHRCLGWREVPCNSAAIGEVARSNEPRIVQVFVEQAPGIQSVEDFERKLYVLRKVIENAVVAAGIETIDKFYVVSMSARTICYKGLMLAHQMAAYYPDLSEPSFESRLALVHQRYSTNTFPTWPLAQPFRFLCHNGEINTLRGNINMMRSRESHLASPFYGEDIKKLAPIHTEGGQRFGHPRQFL